MRIAIAAFLAVTVGGCATVSVYPVETSLTSGPSVEQSALRKASGEFCDLAEAEGWVGKSEGLMRVAQSLFDGEALPDDAKTYAASIGLGERPASEILVTIGSDAEAATKALVKLNAEAEEFMRETSGEDLARADVMKFERALVWAQKSHRAFASAVDVVASDAMVDTRAADSALTTLAVNIDETRALADAMAARLTKVQVDAAS